MLPHPAEQLWSETTNDTPDPTKCLQTAESSRAEGVGDFTDSLFMEHELRVNIWINFFFYLLFLAEEKL